MPLKRSISLPMLIFYGVGTMVGGGFYALVGKVAGEAGMMAPWAILAATLLALFSAFSFAELSGRFPFSAGASRYVQEVFKQRWLSSLTGWLVVCTGVVSAATLATATVGFLQDMIAVPTTLSIVIVVLLMGAIAVWGISESVMVTAIITVIEVGALLIIIGLKSPSLLTLPEQLPAMLPTADVTQWLGIFSGGFLIFYAFLGFEDMVNLAEEVKDVERSLPLSIIATVLITGVLYMGIILVSILSTPIADLGSSQTPLATVLRDYGSLATNGIGFVSLFAGVNGALVQIVMAARVIYGMAGYNAAPQMFRSIHPWTQTPVRSTVLVTVVILGLALFFPLVTLAKATSTIILVVFALVNGVLWWLKRNPLPKLPNVPNYPRWLSAVACALCLGAVVMRIGTLI